MKEVILWTKNMDSAIWKNGTLYEGMFVNSDKSASGDLRNK
jgi:hypothetical protein